MDANIINNRNITISRLLNEDISIKSRDIKILNIFFDKNNLSIEEDYPNLNLYNLKLESPFVINLNYDFDFFDYIIFNDTIEKLINPLEFLKILKKHLKPNAFIIATIPNIMHVSVIKDILNGKFKSSKVEQLNESNINFFTLHEIKKILIESGYNLTSILSIATILSEDDKTLINKLVNLSNPDSKLGFNSYEYIIKANVQKSKTIHDYILNN